jgi:hypothetical protein
MVSSAAPLLKRFNSIELSKNQIQNSEELNHQLPVLFDGMGYPTNHLLIK